MGVDLAGGGYECKWQWPPTLANSPDIGLRRLRQHMGRAIMGINNERDIEANIQIGPTDLGMVRIFVEGNGFEIPMDFEPEEAEEIAEEILAAAKAARSMTKKKR